MSKAKRFTQADVDALQARRPGCVVPVGGPARLPVPPEEPTPSKYRNTRVEYDGRKFQSIWERDRYIQLRHQEGAGLISDLQLQVRFDFVVNGLLICWYQADFTYQEDGALVVEDTKSQATRKKRDYRIKYKLMQACHGITIRETKRRGT